MYIAVGAAGVLLQSVSLVSVQAQRLLSAQNTFKIRKQTLENPDPRFLPDLDNASVLLLRLMLLLLPQLLTLLLLPPH